MKQRISLNAVLFKRRIQSLATSPFMKVVMITPVIASITMIVLWIIFFQSYPPFVPLYYSRPWGEEQLVFPYFLLLLPVGSFLWYASSLLLVYIKMYQYRVFAQLLSITQAVCSLACLYILIRVLLLIF